MFILFFIITISVCETADYEIGSIVPKPKQIQDSASLYAIDALQFKIFIQPSSCYLLKQATIKFYDFTFPDRTIRPNKNLILLENLTIIVQDPSSDIPITKNESYTISFSKNQSFISTQTVWGALRGLQTFSQMIYQKEDKSYVIIPKSVTDNPSVEVRGIVLDVSSNYIPLEKLFKVIDGLSYIKMNSLILCLSNSENFAFPVIDIPELHRFNNNKKHTYAIEELKYLVDYGRRKGIDISAQLKIPDESSSWSGVPDIVIKCKSSSKEKSKAVLNPALNQTYQIIEKVFIQLSTIFSDSILVLGGKFEDVSCWSQNQAVIDFMIKNGIKDDYDALNSLFLDRIASIGQKYFKNIVVSSSPSFIPHKISLKNTIMIDSYKDNFEIMQKFISLGYKLIVTGCYNLTHYEPFHMGFPNFLSCQLDSFNQTQRANIIGGLGYLNHPSEANVLTNVFTTSFAISDSLWNLYSEIDLADAIQRYHEEMCRFSARRIPSRDIEPARSCAIEYYD